MSYKFAWNYIKRIEKLLGESVVLRYKGGASRGGAKLTEIGKLLINSYEQFYNTLNSCLGEKRNFGILGLTKNYINVRVETIKRGESASIVTGIISKGTHLTVTITNESLSNLQVKKGAEFKLLIKATSMNVVI